MTLEEIQKEWEQDSKIDILNLEQLESQVQELHSKYHRWHDEESKKLWVLRAQYNTLFLQKYEFYTQGPNEDTPKEWAQPAIGRVLKTEAEKYLSGDDDLNRKQFEINLAEQKVDKLKDIIKQTTNRHFVLKQLMDWQKFQAGV